MNSGNMRLLLVEDEEKVVRFVTLGLKAERFAVDDARDGRTGLEMALKTPYDFLIVDLTLPELSGTELISRLRRHNTTVPIIVLTARDAVDDKVKNFEAGADDYLTKPFAFAELLVRIKALLRRGQTNHSNAIRVAGLEIDRINHQCFCRLSYYTYQKITLTKRSSAKITHEYSLASF